MALDKLIIQIPCLNEEETLAQTIAALPKTLPPFKTTEILIIDDGSTDRTAEIAKAAGAHHILSLHSNRGLAQAFAAGIQHALALGADVIVNTDGDNQYRAEDISSLLEPIIRNEARIVIGTRPIDEIDNFSSTKKKLQKLGSWVVRQLSGTHIIDTTSGFRAIHRDAAERLHIHTKFSYTVEMIMQAGFERIPMKCTPIRVNPVHRPSRLMNNIPEYIMRQVITMGQLCWRYRPMRICMPIASSLVTLALILAHFPHHDMLSLVIQLLIILALIIVKIGMARHALLLVRKKKERA